MKQNLDGLFGDLYNTATRRHALSWGLKHLNGLALRSFYQHAQSVPLDSDLVAQIRAKAALQAAQGIGADPEPAPRSAQPPALQDLAPPPQPAPKPADSGGSGWMLVFLLGGLAWLAFRKKKNGG